MENVRRPLSRLWLFQAAVFALLGYIPRLSGLECYCYNEPHFGFPLCFFEFDRCTGDVCYVHKELHDDGIFYSTWSCLLESIHHIDHICNQGSFNTSTEAYICCSDRDNCNQHLQIELPIERTPASTDAVTSAPVTMIEGSGSGSGNSPLDPSTTSTEQPDLLPTSRSTPVSSHPTSRLPSTSTTLRTATTQPASTPTADTSLQCFCSACPTRQSSCGPNSECYVGRDFQPRQDVGGTTAVGVPESYSWGCFNESEAATKCRETDKYSCCSDEDLCNERLQPPPLKCFCASGTCLDGQGYVSCGANSTCYVGLPTDSSSTNDSPDSLAWGCFDQSEARMKCNNTRRYNCCSDRDYCNKDLDPPTRRNEEECTSATGGCQTKEQQDFVLLPLVASVTVVVVLVVLIILALLFVALLIRIRRLKRGEPVKTTSTTSDSSENSVTTESESLPSPTSTSSPHHHYLHITADDPAFGSSLNKCNVSKA